MWESEQLTSEGKIEVALPASCSDKRPCGVLLLTHTKVWSVKTGRLYIKEE